MKQCWYVYMIETTTGCLYTGITVDVEKRFKNHCDGKGAKFFRIHPPQKVVYIDEMEGKEPALVREHEIKQWSVEKKRELILTMKHPIQIESTKIESLPRKHKIRDKK